MNDWNELDAILKRYGDTFINSHGVLFNRVAPGFMFVSSLWPGHSVYDISLAYFCNVASDFFERLEIDNATQLHQVKPEVFFKLFHVGEVIIVCCTDNDETLEFQMIEGMLIAHEEDSELGHEVIQKLITAEDFMEYSKQYFLNLKRELSGRNCATNNTDKKNGK